MKFNAISSLTFGIVPRIHKKILKFNYIILALVPIGKNMNNGIWDVDGPYKSFTNI